MLSILGLDGLIEKWVLPINAVILLDYFYMNICMVD